VHTPDGLTAGAWRKGVETYAALKSAGKDTGVVAYGAASQMGGSPSTVSGSALQSGNVKTFLRDKKFGFISPAGGGADIFFHVRAVAPPGLVVRAGTAVTFSVGTDGRGRRECISVQRASETRAATGGGKVLLRCFSMNQPFAGLVAHGYKSLETRNGSMFMGSEGEQVLLHVGKRTYPDGGKHLDIMRRAGVSEPEIERLTRLRSGFARGQIVAILSLGKTELLDRTTRCTHAVEHAVCAYGDDMGKFATRVLRTAWLSTPIPLRGQPGLFKVEVPENVIPEGWPLDAAGSSRNTVDPARRDTNLLIDC